MSGTQIPSEPTITQAECLRRLQPLGLSVTGSRFVYLVDKHHVPHEINLLSSRGGAPNRRYYWSVIKAFFLTFLKPVHHGKGNK